jgi:cytochrome b
MQRVKIWDSFVRLSHWLMVVLLVAMWWTADNDYMEWLAYNPTGVGPRW